MAEARSRREWNHTSAILAMLVNVNRGKKGRRAKPSDFNPHMRRGGLSGSPKPKGNIRILKDVFVDRKKV